MGLFFLINTRWICKNDYDEQMIKVYYSPTNYFCSFHDILAQIA